MDATVCRHCGVGTLELDALLGVCACSVCGRVDESFFYLQPAADAGSVLVVPTQESSSVVTPKGRLNESAWLEMIEIIGARLHAPNKVVEEAQALFRETRHLHQNRSYSRILFSGTLLYAASRRFHLPLTLSDLTAVSGISHSRLSRHYREIVFGAQLQLPLCCLKEHVVRCIEDVEEEMEEAKWHNTVKQRRQLMTEAKDLASLFISAEISHTIPDPILLSVVLIYVAWLVCGLGKEVCFKALLCERYRMKRAVLTRAFRTVRNVLLEQCSRIPGAMPWLSIKNVLQFLPALMNYHHNLQNFQQRLTGSMEAPEMAMKVRKLKRSYSEPNGHTVPCVMKKPRYLTLLEASLKSQGSHRSEKVSPGMQKKEKRKLGFDLFLQSVQKKRRAAGQSELPCFQGTTALLEQGRSVGYCYSLPLKPFAGDLSEIRRGSFNPHSLKPPPVTSIKRRASERRPASKGRSLGDMTSGEADLDTELESYLLKPAEILLKQLAMTLSPLPKRPQ